MIASDKQAILHIPLMQRTLAVQHEALRTLGKALAARIQQSGAITASSLNNAQVQAFQLARLLAEHASAEAMVAYAERDNADSFEKHLGVMYAAESAIGLAKNVQFDSTNFGVTSQDTFDGLASLARHLRVHSTFDGWVRLGESLLERNRDLSGSPALGSAHIECKEMFARFSDSVLAPLAERIHRDDRIIPDDVLRQLAELGVFGISIPAEYGGSFYDHVLMVVATEELSRGSLGAGGSVLTRPEICAKALLAGGTDEQKKRWLPVIASGEKMVSILVTEPNTGSDVASVSVSASKVENGYVLKGEKTWATFAGRSEILCTLARTGTPDSGHKGLSLFIVEKPYQPGSDEYQFKHVQGSGGTIEGKAIPTIGYRGMHSFSVSFDNYFVPQENLIGEEGRGFYLQMQGFAGGRIQTAARALGVMEAAFRSALDYVKTRKLFGHRLADFALTKFKLAQMAARIQADRQLAYRVARMMDNGGGTAEASLVKLLACRDAEWVTREAMQLHGGMGYSEEYPVSRYFLDARVLSIFEGAEEVLALQVIARPFLQQLLEELSHEQ
jgi:(2S)-methylsuccinyl-CoA dehydrogenase